MMTTGASLPVITQDGIQSAVEAFHRKEGRPTKYTDDIAAEIVARLANGETIKGICSDKHMPAFSTVYDWARNSAEFAHSLACARRSQATALVEEGLETLDNCDGTVMSQVQKADKRAQYRMAMAKAFDRDTYGDKVQNDVNIRGVMVQTSCRELADLMGE